MNNQLPDQMKMTVQDIQGVIVPSSCQIDFVQMKYNGVESICWQELFSEFNKLYAITYSSSIGFVHQLLNQFEYAEIIITHETSD